MIASFLKEEEEVACPCSWASSWPGQGVRDVNVTTTGSLTRSLFSGALPGTLPRCGDHDSTVGLVGFDSYASGSDMSSQFE